MENREACPSKSLTAEGESTMPYYKGVIDALIANRHDDEAKSVAERLLRLRSRLTKQIPARNVSAEDPPGSPGCITSGERSSSPTICR